MKKTVINNLRLYDSLSSNLSVVFDEKILYTGPGEYVRGCLGTDEEYDLYDGGGLIIAPGFIDVHNHGGGGYDFACADEKGTVDAVKAHLKQGTTTLLPTLVSEDFEGVQQFYDVYRKVKKTFWGNCLSGIHLEGPFLNPARKGGMCLDLLKLPTEENYLPLLADGFDIVRRITMAPELPGAFDLADRLSSMGIVVSAGHTEASPEIIREAAHHGFCLGTHIFNAMSSMHKEGIFRKSGAAEAILSDENYYVEAISDCIHVPKELLKLCWQIKGPGKMLLITDAISAAGCDISKENNFIFLGNSIVIEDNVAKLSDRSALAGSIASGISMLKSAVSAGIPFTDCVKMMTETPAKIFGLSSKGRIIPGFDADFVILSEDLNIKKVFKSGVSVL